MAERARGVGAALISSVADRARIQAAAPFDPTVTERGPPCVREIRIRMSSSKRLGPTCWRQYPVYAKEL